MAIGEIGIAPDEFEMMTWQHFELKVRGYFMKLMRYRAISRDLMHFFDTIINGDKAVPIEELGLLPWDLAEEEVFEPVQISPEKQAEINRRFEIAMNRYKEEQNGKS